MFIFYTFIFIWLIFYNSKFIITTQYKKIIFIHKIWPIT